MSLLYRFIRLTLLVIFKTFFRFEVLHSENVPKKGGVIVVSNHASHLDPLVVGCAIKKRQPTYMAKRSLFHLPIIGAFVRTFSFPVDRERTQPSTVKEAVRRLKNGELIVMFPEGSRSRDGSLLEAKRGTGMIAALAKVMIVPAFIDGTNKAWPAGARFFRPAKIRVIFGKPMDFKKAENGKDFQEKIGNDIMEAIRNLSLKLENQKS